MADSYSTLPSSADEAKRLGLKRFFTGKVCKNGHVSPRYLATDNPCVQCVAERNARWKETSPDAYAVAMANRAERAKQWHAENYLKNRSRFIERAKMHYQANKDDKLAYQREYRILNYEEVRQRDNAYKARNSARLVEKARKWKEANRDQWRLISLLSVRRRNARKLKALPKWADEQKIAAIYAECKRITAETGKEHHVDHIIPLMGKTVCGLHVEHNLRIIPAKENLRKGNKHVIC